MKDIYFRRDLRAALLVIVGISIGAAAGMLLTALVLPQGWLAEGFGDCPARLAGQPCLSCGMTTAVYALSRGDFSAARAAHPAALPLAGAAVGVFLYLLHRHLRRGAQPDRRPRLFAILSGGSPCK